MNPLLSRWVDQNRLELTREPYPGFEEDLERRLWIPGQRAFYMPPTCRLFMPADHKGLITLTMADMTALERGLGGFISEDPVSGRRIRGRVNFGHLGQLTDLEIAMVLQTGREIIADEPAKRARRVIEASLSAVVRQRVVETASEGHALGR